MPASPIQTIDLNAPRPDPQALTDSIVGYFADKDKKEKEKTASTALAKSLGIAEDEIEDFAAMDLGRQQLFIQAEQQREVNLQREIAEIDRQTNNKIKAFDKTFQQDDIKKAIQEGEDRRNEVVARSLSRKKKTLDVVKGEEAAGEDADLTEELRADAKEPELAGVPGAPKELKAKEVGGIAPQLKRPGTQDENVRRESNAVKFAKQGAPRQTGNFKTDSSNTQRYLTDLGAQLKKKGYSEAQTNNILSQTLKSSSKDLDIATKLNANPDDPEAREELRQQYLKKNKRSLFGKPTFDQEEAADKFADDFIKKQLPEINKFYSDPFIKKLLSLENKKLESTQQRRRKRRSSANDRTIQDLQKVIEEG